MQGFLAAVGVAAITFVILMAIRLSRGFGDHMRIVNSMDLSPEQGKALSRLSAIMTARMNRPMRRPERYFVGTVVLAMDDEVAAEVANRLTSDFEAMAIFGRTIKDMEDFARNNPDLMDRIEDASACSSR